MTITLQLVLRAMLAEPARERELVAAAATSYLTAAGGSAHTSEQVTGNGLLLPKRYDFSKIIGSPKVGLTLSLLQQPTQRRRQHLSP